MAAVNAVMGAAQRDGQYERLPARTPPSRARPARCCALPPIAAPGARARTRGRRAAGLARQPDRAARAARGKAGHAGMPAGRRMDRAADRARACAAGDIMVLARRRDRLAAMEDELRALHIPAQQPEKTDLCEAPEVQDIVALLDVLVSPAHDLSLARALKSPLFGLRRRRAGGAGAAARAAPAPTARRAPGSSCCRRDATCPRRCAQSPATLRALASAGCERCRRTTRCRRSTTRATCWRASRAARRRRCAPAVLANLRALLGAALQVDGGALRHALCASCARSRRAASAAPRVGSARRGAPAHRARRQGPGGAASCCCSTPTARRPRAETMGVLSNGPARRRRPGASPSSPARRGRPPAAPRRWRWSRPRASARSSTRSTWR